MAIEQIEQLDKKIEELQKEKQIALLQQEIEKIKKTDKETITEEYSYYSSFPYYPYYSWRPGYPYYTSPSSPQDVWYSQQKPVK